jgi:hypothetical protein
MTAQDAIKGASALVGAHQAGDTLDGPEASEDLKTLQNMINSWSAEGLMIPSVTKESYPLVSSQASYTIGSGGDFDTTRPYKIDGAFIRVSDIDYHVYIIEENEYREIHQKNTESDWPDCLYYHRSNPLGIIYVYPVPNGAPTLHLDLWTPLSTPSLITSSITFPPEYDEALVFNLAKRFAPKYGQTLNADARIIAKESKETIESNNFAPIPQSKFEGGLINRGYGSSNIIEDN